MKRIKINGHALCVWFLGSMITFSATSQVPVQNRFLLKKTEISLHSSIYWNLEKSFGEGQWNNVIQELRLQGYIYFSEQFRLDIRDENRFRGKKSTNELTQFKLNYRNTFKFKSDTTFINNGISVVADVGRLQWRPNFTNPQLLLENADLFFHPIQFWGASLECTVPLFKDRLLQVRFRGHSGELLNQSEVKPIVQDFYVLLTKFTKYNLGLEAQFGEAQGSQHFVNYAHLTYAPKWENVTFTFKAGKLPTFDATPYGVHIGFNRDFKFLALGGFYEKRINQAKGEHIAGFYWRVIGPAKLAKAFQVFNFSFSFNTNSIIAFIPVAKVSIQHQ